MNLEQRRLERKKQDLSRQHTDWLEVMSKQVEENLARHRQRVSREESKRPKSQP